VAKLVVVLGGLGRGHAGLVEASLAIGLHPSCIHIATLAVRYCQITEAHYNSGVGLSLVTSMKEMKHGSAEVSR
jgi:hypothetical protein